MSISGSCLPQPSKYPEKPLVALPDRDKIQTKGLPHQYRQYQLYSLRVAWIFVILTVVPSILPEIRYDAWHQNHIYTDSQLVLWYIEGTTPKIDLFQFLCMASRISCSKINLQSKLLRTGCSLFMLACKHRWLSILQVCSTFCYFKILSYSFVQWTFKNNTMCGSRVGGRG